jgi:hypothetical protein
VGLSLRSKPRVLYICGWGRSGTTLVDRIIGEVPGFASLGELRSLWDADSSRQTCGCGELVAECRVWGPILEAMSAASGYTWGSVQRLRDESTRSRHVLGLWRAARTASGVKSPSAERYGDVLVGLYAAVQASVGAGVVIDSSKHPAEALLLASRPDIDLTVLHLVRDPRGAAFSWSGRRGETTKERRATDQPPYRGIMSSSAWWSAWNLIAEGLVRPTLGARYISMRYEDVMVAPRDRLAAVVQRLGASGGDLPFVGADEVMLRPSHTVAGNPSRLTSGPVNLAVDREWEAAMGRADRWKATLPALPMLRHFGYHINNFERGSVPKAGSLRA